MTQALWEYVPQFFLGLFFMAAAFLKWWEGLFGPHPIPLDTIIKVWTENKWPVEIYGYFLNAGLPYVNMMTWVVIALQAVAGFLLIIRYQSWLGGAIIIFVQANIYLAIYHQVELRILNSIAIWAGIFYFARSDMKGKMWALMTYALVFLLFFDLYSRFTMAGDLFISNFSWQYEDFTYHTMSSWPGLKSFVVSFSSTKWGPTLWASGWWIKLFLALSMLTKYRLYAGAFLAVFMLWTTLIWLNTYSCVGTFWVLTLFIWVTHELIVQRMTKTPPVSLLP